LLSGQSHLQAVKANEVTAGLRPNPVFTSANEDFNFGDLSNINPNVDKTQNISWLIERGGKRRSRLESARLGTVVATDSYHDAERQLVFAFKQGFVAMLLAKADLNLAEENLRDYSKTVQLNEIRFKAGEISGTDFSRIVLQRSRFESDLLNAQLALSQARTQLLTFLGFDTFPPSFDVQGGLESAPLNLDLDQLKRAALAARPDYLAAMDGVRKAQADVKLADAGGAADLTAATEYKRNGSDNFAGFVFSFPLRIFDRNQGEKERTRSELEASKSAEAAARAQVLSDVDQAYAAYQSSLARAKLYSDDYLSRARDVRDRTEFSYRNGGSSLLEYIDAIRDYRDIELAALSANAQVQNSIHQLSFVTATEIYP